MLKKRYRTYKWVIPVLSLALGLLMLWSWPPGAAGQGQIYYVRPDGGSAEECTGQVDTPS